MKKLFTLFICTILLLLINSLAQAAVLEVRPSGGGIGTLGDVYPSIQAAIDDTNPGDTILIHNGTYDETMDIDGKINLTLQGESKENTIIKSSSVISWAIPGYPQYDGRMTVVRIYDSNVITIENMTFDCNNMKGNNRFCISGWDSEVTVDNCILKNMSIDDLSGGYYELISYFRAPGYDDASRAAVTFTANTFIEPGRVGIVTHDYIDATISGNTFYKTIGDFGYAIEMGSQSTGQIVGNTIYGYDVPAASDGSESAGIYVENCFTGTAFGGSPHVDKGVLVQGNEIYDCQYAMWIGNGYNTYAGDVDITVTLSGNNFHDNVQGGLIIQDEDAEDGSSVTVNGSGNTIVDNNEVGLWVFTQGDGDIAVNLTGETISGNNNGIYVADYAGGPSASSYNVAIDGSKINGNSSYGIENAVPTIVVDAQNNWWGDATGPYDGSNDTGTGGLYNPGGLGDSVTDYVDYEPWYASESMLVPVTVYVDDTNVVRAYAETIQEGIGAAYDGDTIEVSEGTYVEDGQIVIDRDLTIKGGSKPTIMTNQDTGTSGDPRGWFLVNDGIELHLQDLILDGSGYNVHQGIRHKGHGTITNVDFKNIDYPPPVYAGLAVAAFGDGTVDITGCTFENIGRVGVLYFGSGVNGSVYSNNTYTGKGPGDWLDYGVEVGGGAVAEIKDSNITDCNGIALVDGSTSAGILVTTYWGEGTEATITGNTFMDNTTGIGVGYDSNDTSVVVARCNKIDGNFEGGVDNIVGAENSVDARYNWWGDASGPSGQGGGTGDAVSENVEFFPWLLSVNCDDYTIMEADYVVDDDWEGYPDWTTVTVEGTDYYIGFNAFGTIQEAIDAASDGNNIRVLDGTYEEEVVIDKADLMLQSLSMPVIKPLTTPTNSFQAAVYITANGVTVDGFEIDGTTVCDNCILGWETSGLTIKNNVIHGAVHAWDGCGILLFSWGNGGTVYGNLIQNNEVYDTGRMGIMVMDYGSTYSVTSDNVITGNVVYDTWKKGWDWDDHGGSIQINVAKNCSITDNIIYDSNDRGVYMFGSASGNEIAGNTITNNPIGIQFWISGEGGTTIDWGGETAASPKVRSNNIYDNDVGAISSNIAGPNMVMEAAYNFWGDVSGPNDPEGTSETDGTTCPDVELVSNEDGLGDAVSENVRYCAWLTTPACTSIKPCLEGDLNYDGCVNMVDVAILASRWLDGCE